MLLACRQQGVTAGVERIREGVKRAIPGFNDLQLASVVHRTLRSLIKVILGSETGFLIIFFYLGSKGLLHWPRLLPCDP